MKTTEILLTLHCYRANIFGKQPKNCDYNLAHYVGLRGKKCFAHVCNTVRNHLNWIDKPSITRAN